MIKVQFKGKCPACGGTRPTRPHSGGFLTLKHLEPKSHYRSCDGGYVSTSDVRGWVMAQRGDAQAIVDSRDQRREAARVKYEAELAEIDTLIAGKRDEIKACDAAVAKIDKAAAKVQS